MLKLLLLLISFSSYAREGAFHLFMKDFHGREVHVYLPSGYESSRGHYPVLYMHDGQNLFDARRSPFGKTWNTQETLNHLIRTGRISPVIVVGIDNTTNRTFDYTHDYDAREGKGGGADRYLDQVVFELIPLIKKHLRVKGGRQSTAIMGSSLGGLVSLYAGVTYPYAFGKVAALSPSIWWNHESIITVLKNGPVPLALYLDSGDVGGERPQDVLKLQNSLKHRFNEGKLQVVIQQGHNHSEESWAARFPLALIHLFKVPTHFW